MIIRLRLCVLFLLLVAHSFAAVGDTVKVEGVQQPDLDTLHSPKKAAIFSAVVPGLGQIYNHKYWKVPLVYAGLGASIYFIVDNNRQYQSYRTEYIYRLNNPGFGQNGDLINYSDSQLRTLADQYRRYRDLTVIACAAVYALQIIDATVDAYLWRFDTSDNLSFHFRPTLLNTTQLTPGFRFLLKF